MILTLDDLRTRYGFSFPASQDEYYSALLATAEEEVLAWAEIEQGEVEEIFTEEASGFVLTHTPVLEVRSVTVDGIECGFRFEKRANYLEPEITGSKVSVKYVCGWPDGEVPSSICTAIAFTAQHLFRLSGAKLLGITQRSAEGGTETIEQSTPPLAVQKMLERFRRNKAL